MLRTRLIGAVLGMAGLLLLAITGSGQEKLGLAGASDSLRAALLRTPEVQKELKLTRQQIEKIIRIAEQAKTSKKNAEEASGKGKGRDKGKAKADDPVAKEQERIAKEAMGPVFAELERDTDEQLSSILDSRQRTRLTQIVLRVEGPSAFVTPELIDALALGPEQLELIQEILGGIKTEQDAYKESRKQANELAKASGDLDLEKMRKHEEKTQTRSYSFKRKLLISSRRAPSRRRSARSKPRRACERDRTISTSGCSIRSKPSSLAGSARSSPGWRGSRSTFPRSALDRPARQNDETVRPAGVVGENPRRAGRNRPAGPEICGRFCGQCAKNPWF
jgi:hypothetical protein